jgi:hypothetical protein
MGTRAARLPANPPVFAPVLWSLKVVSCASRAVPFSHPPPPPPLWPHHPRFCFAFSFVRGLYATLGRTLADDFGEFGWAQCLVISKLNNWGPLTTNMLFIGEPGACGRFYVLPAPHPLPAACPRARSLPGALGGVSEVAGHVLCEQEGWGETPVWLCTG